MEPIPRGTNLFGKPMDWVHKLTQLKVGVSRGGATIRQIHHDSFGRRFPVEHVFEDRGEGEEEIRDRVGRSMGYALAGSVNDLVALNRIRGMVYNIFQLLPAVKGDEKLRKRAQKALELAHGQLGEPTVFEKKELKRAIGGHLSGPQLKAEKAEERKRKAEWRVKDLLLESENRPLEQSELDELRKAQDWLQSGQVEKERETAVKHKRAVKAKGLDVDARVKQIAQELGEELGGLRSRRDSLKGAVRRKQAKGRNPTKAELAKIESLKNQIKRKRGDLRITNIQQKVRVVNGALQLITGYTETRFKGKRRKQYKVAKKGNWPSARWKLEPALGLAERRMRDLRQYIIPVLSKRNENYQPLVDALESLGRLHGAMLGTAATLHGSLSQEDAAKVATHLRQNVMRTYFRRFTPQQEMKETHGAWKGISSAIKALEARGAPDPVAARNHLLAAVRQVETAHARILDHAQAIGRPRT